MVAQHQNWGGGERKFRELLAYRCMYLSVCPQLEMILEYAVMDFCDAWIHQSSGRGQYECSGRMDKVRERGAPLPGNDKEYWGNYHTGIWRKREEGGRKKRRGRKEKEEKRQKEEAEIEEFIEEEHGDHGDDKLKGCRMGRSDKVSLWYVSLLINTRFRFFYFRISNC